MVIKLIEDGKIKIECQIILLEIRFKDKIKYCKWSVPLNCIIFSITFSGWSRKSEC